MTPSPFIQQRLRHQVLSRHGYRPPTEVVSWFGALQAQDRASVQWAVGLRSKADKTAVERAFREKRIIRTWLQRGTLQIVAAQDYRWMLSLLGPRLKAGSKRRLKQLALDPATLEESYAVIKNRLTEKGPQTRRQITAALEQAGISPAGPRVYHILRQAGFAGLICFGPMVDNKDSFVLLEDWVPAGRELVGGEALAELAFRYFRSHGPATLDDFVWWSGLTKTKARTALDLCQAQLQKEIFDELTYWGPKRESASAGKPPSVSLLPAYDEYYLGYKDRQVLLAPCVDANAISSGGVFRPMVVIDGQISGTWKQTSKNARVLITLKLSRSLSEGEKAALQAAADRYGAFFAMPVTVR